MAFRGFHGGDHHGGGLGCLPINISFGGGPQAFMPGYAPHFQPYMPMAAYGAARGVRPYQQTPIYGGSPGMATQQPQLDGWSPDAPDSGGPGILASISSWFSNFSNSVSSKLHDMQAQNTQPTAPTVVTPAPDTTTVLERG